MGILNFEKLPISTLVGADTKTLKAVLEGFEAPKGYRGKLRLTRWVQGLLSPFYRKNTRCYERLEPHPGEQAPVFIIGHWRSGTTYMHDLFCQDERFGYCITYQTVFPHLMLWGAPFFKAVVKCFMPSTRATDKMELGNEVPQEEEIALSNMSPMGHYHFLTFPQQVAALRSGSLTLETATPEQIRDLGEAQRKLMRISLYTQHKERFLSKNPPHTGRVKELLELFPEAKFIYLVRNPYTVFESTRNFFTKTAQSTGLEPLPADFEEQMLLNYRALYEKYEADKPLIPEGHLVEVKFEDFEQEPLRWVEHIYQTLNLGDFEQVRPAMERFVASKRGHKKNRYTYDERTLELVNRYCAEAIRQWGYTL